MIIVSNTSPIINLSAIGQFSLLEKLFDTIYIPQAVYHEIVVLGTGEPGSKEIQESNKIVITKVSPSPILSLLEAASALETTSITISLKQLVNREKVTRS